MMFRGWLKSLKFEEEDPDFLLPVALLEADYYRSSLHRVYYQNLQSPGFITHNSSGFIYRSLWEDQGGGASLREEDEEKWKDEEKSDWWRHDGGDRGETGADGVGGGMGRQSSQHGGWKLRLHLVSHRSETITKVTNLPQHCPVEAMATVVKEAEEGCKRERKWCWTEEAVLVVMKRNL